MHSADTVECLPSQFWTACNFARISFNLSLLNWYCIGVYHELNGHWQNLWCGHNKELLQCCTSIRGWNLGRCMSAWQKGVYRVHAGTRESLGVYIHCLGEWWRRKPLDSRRRHCLTSDTFVPSTIKQSNAKRRRWKC